MTVTANNYFAADELDFIIVDYPLYSLTDGNRHH